MREIIIQSTEQYLYNDGCLNQETLEAISNVENNKGLIGVENAEDLFKKLGI